MQDQSSSQALKLVYVLYWFQQRNFYLFQNIFGQASSRNRSTEREPDFHRENRDEGVENLQADDCFQPQLHGEKQTGL